MPHRSRTTHQTERQRRKANFFFCFITIIGIPFALQHLKLAVISLAPIGKTVVPIEEAARARYRTR